MVLRDYVPDCYHYLSITTMILIIKLGKGGDLPQRIPTLKVTRRFDHLVL